MQSITDFVAAKCAKYAKRELLYDDSSKETLSYEMFALNVQKAQNFFRDEISEQSPLTFSVIAPNCPNYLYAVLGLLACEAVAVNLNPNLGDKELVERLRLAEVQVLVCSQSYYNRLMIILPQTTICKVFVLDDTSVKFNIVKQKDDQRVQLNLCLPERSAFIQYTGGTSGTTKAAVIRHQNVIENIKQLNNHFNKYMLMNELVVLVAFPFYHIFAVVFNFLFFLGNGGKIILYQNMRDTALIIDLLEQNKVNFTVGVNTWYKKLMQNPAFKRLDFSALRACIAGGEYVPVSTKIEWKELTGKLLSSGYGLTETSSLSIISPLEAREDIMDSIGKPIESTEVRLLDEKDCWIEGLDRPGELVLKGPQVFEGYYNNHEETENAFYQGWFRTGDIAQRVTQDQYKIVDRKKDMISVSGNKVYPNEVEAVIVNLDGVLDVAVVGRASQKSGEEVVAFVSKDVRTELSEEEIVVFCKNQLARFKVPKAVFFLDELPKTPIGKTARKVLRERLKNESWR